MYLPQRFKIYEGLYVKKKKNQFACSGMTNNTVWGYDGGTAVKLRKNNVATAIKCDSLVQIQRENMLMCTALLFKLGKIEIRGSVQWFEMATARPARRCWASNTCLALQHLQSEFSIDALTAAMGLHLMLWTQETLSGGCKIYPTVFRDPSRARTRKVNRHAEEAYFGPDFQVTAGFNVHQAIEV